MKGFVIYLTEDSIETNRTNIRDQIIDIFDDPNNINMITFNDELDMYKIIQKELKGATGVTAYNLWEDKDHLYAGYFVDAIDLIDMTEQDEKKIEESRKKIKLNQFASQISNQTVASSMVIVKKRLTYQIENNNVKTISVPETINSMNELIDMIESIVIKEGVVVKTDGTLETYKYIANPLEHFMLTDSRYAEHYIYHEYEVYTHVIMIIVDVEKSNDKLNSKATLLAGNPVYGDVFVGMYKKSDYNESVPYVNLSIEVFKKILDIRSKSTDLTTNKTKSDNEYINFEKLLEIENAKHQQMINKNAEDIKGVSLNIK